MSDNIYSQRAALSVALAWMTIRAGGMAGRGLDTRADPDSDWGHVLYIETPEGDQISYHFAPRDVKLLDGLPGYGVPWDGKFTGRDNFWVCQYKAPAFDVETAESVAMRRLSGFAWNRWLIERGRLARDTDVSAEAAEAILLSYATKWPGVDTAKK